MTYFTNMIFALIKNVSNEDKPYAAYLNCFFLFLFGGCMLVATFHSISQLSKLYSKMLHIKFYMNSTKPRGQDKSKNVNKI